MYIGKEPVVGNFQVCDAITVVNGQAAYSLTVGSAAVSPESANHMLVSLNGVLQKPGSSFTISGSTMTFASNLATGDVIDFVQILGNVLDLGQPSDDTVKTASLQANAVTGAKLNTDVISAQTALAAEPADTDEFLVSDAGVLKRIDYSLIKASSTHTLLSTSTVSSGVAQVDITSNIDSTYKTYMFDLINIHPATDNSALRLLFQIGGSFVTSNIYDYAVHRIQSNNSDSYDYDNDTDGMTINSNLGNAADESISGRIFLHNPSDTTFNTTMLFNLAYFNNNNVFTQTHGGCGLDNSGAVTGVRFAFSNGGNLDSGIIKLYGVT